MDILNKLNKLRKKENELLAISIYLNKQIKINKEKREENGQQENKLKEQYIIDSHYEIYPLYMVAKEGYKCLMLELITNPNNVGQSRKATLKDLVVRFDLYLKLKDTYIYNVLEDV